MSGELCTDPARENAADAHATGIFVRARNSAGFWINADIAQLDRHSLLSWLYAVDGNFLFAHNRAVSTVLILLGHEPLAREVPR